MFNLFASFLLTFSPSFFCIQAQTLTIGLILPAEEHVPYNIHLVRPAIDIALSNVTHLLPNYAINVIEKDSKNDEVHGATSAIELSKQANVFFGPVNSYGAAPVVRYNMLLWRKPVLIAGVPEYQFDNKTEYQLLTRVQLTYTHAMLIFKYFKSAFNWNKFGLLFYYDKSLSIPGKYFHVSWAATEVLDINGGDRFVEFFGGKEKLNARERLVRASTKVRCKRLGHPPLPSHATLINTSPSKIYHYLCGISTAIFLIQLFF